MPPPSANFKYSMKNRVTQKCWIFVYKNVSQIVLLFAKCLAFCTVWMNGMPRFYVGKLLLHHYKSDLAHTSDRCSSVIELYLSEI